MEDAWYPAAADYWVRGDEEAEYPSRYGDLFAAPDVAQCKTKKGLPWRAVQILYPSCEIGAKATESTEVQVARVQVVSSMSAKVRAPLRLGFAERDGELQVALANTFWLPPTPGTPDDEDQFSDFRTCQRVPSRRAGGGGTLGGTDP